MGELSSVRMGREGCPGRMAGGADLWWYSCQVETGVGLDTGKGMAMRRETWKRRGRVKVCEKQGGGGSAERGKTCRY